MLHMLHRQLADHAIIGDKSRRAIRLRELMEQGHTEEAAQKILIEQDLRAMASIAPIVAGGIQYGAARAMRAASDIDDIVRRHEYGDEADPSFTDTDMEIAEILQEDAPRKPFTDEADGGIVETESDTKPDNSISENSFVLRGTQYSPEYAQKLTDTHKIFKDNGYEASEHALNRIFGRINQGKIKSIEQVVDVLKTGTTYKDTLNGGLIKFKDGVAIAISDDGVIKTVIGAAKVKPSWEEVK